MERYHRNKELSTSLFVIKTRRLDRNNCVVLKSFRARHIFVKQFQLSGIKNGRCARIRKCRRV